MIPKISILIRCYNEEQHIGRLLSGITQQNIKDVEIIVVDSGSTDATLSIAARYPVKIVSIRPEEFSFGRAINFGCQFASSEFIVLASAHVYPVYRDWLENLIIPFSNNTIALTYGKQRGTDVSKYSEKQILAAWFPDDMSMMGLQEHPFCNNANAAIRRSVWDAFPYNEELTGLEDLDWAKRVILSGHRIVYVPNATVIHVHDEKWGQILNRYKREAIALKQIYPTERFNFLTFLRLLSSNIANDYCRALKDGVFINNIYSILLFRLMQFWGTYQGFRDKQLINRQIRERFYYPGVHLHCKESLKNEEQRIDYSKHEKTVV